MKKTNQKAATLKMNVEQLSTLHLDLVGGGASTNFVATNRAVTNANMTNANLTNVNLTNLFVATN